MIVEEFPEEKQCKTAGREDMSESDYSSWQKTDSAGGKQQNFSISVFHTALLRFCASMIQDQVNEGDQKQSEEVNEQVKSSSGSEVTVETLEENDRGDIEKTRADTLEDTSSEGVICPPPSPARMKAVLTTPTFSLKYDTLHLYMRTDLNSPYAVGQSRKNNIL